MKNLLLTITSLIIVTSCKAQIAPIFRIDRDVSEGTHFKDLDNDFDKFIGTWKWQSNDSIITMVLEKQENVYFNDTNQYEDYIIGEYKFEVNGNVIQNYLPRLNDSNLQGLDHYISGNSLLQKEQRPTCNSCSLTERRILLYFDDPNREYMLTAIALRRLPQGLGTEPPKLKGYLFVLDNSVVPIGAQENIRIPFGEYVFVKQ